MDISHAMMIGLKGFLFWAASSCCWFFLARSVARLAFGKLWAARLLLFFGLLATWAFFVPATTKAYTGNRADSGDANRREEYTARSSAKFYGAQTIWGWGALVLVELPKLKRRELQSC